VQAVRVLPHEDSDHVAARRHGADAVQHDALDLDLDDAVGEPDRSASVIWLQRTKTVPPVSQRWTEKPSRLASSRTTTPARRGRSSA